MSLPIVIIKGANLGADPDLRVTASSARVARLRIACNSPVEGAPVQWWTVEVWGRDAERVSAEAAKGYRVDLAGQIRLDAWTDNDGQARERLVIVAQSISTSPPRAKGDRDV